MENGALEDRIISRMALEFKVSPSESYHALVLLTRTIGISTVAATLPWAKGVIENRKKVEVYHFARKEGWTEKLLHPDRSG